MRHINGHSLKISVDGNGYNKVYLYPDQNNTHSIGVKLARLMLSTFVGKPPSPKHTADHINGDKVNDMLPNLRWATKTEQCLNRTIPKAKKNASLIVHNGREQTAKEWAFEMNKSNNSIIGYARKDGDWSFKVFLNLEGEIWKQVKDSNTSMGNWEISNKGRVAFVSKHFRNVMTSDQLSCIGGGYPSIGIKGVQNYTHVLAFKTFFPEEWANKRDDQFVLHADDDKKNFYIDNLRLGTIHENSREAHDNGCHDGKSSQRMSCVATSVIDGTEQKFESKREAVRWLREHINPKASWGGINDCIHNKERKSAYGFIWR